MNSVVEAAITNMADKFIVQIVESKIELDVFKSAASGIGYMHGVQAMDGITIAKRDELCAQIKTAAEATLETMSAIRRLHARVVP